MVESNKRLLNLLWLILLVKNLCSLVLVWKLCTLDSAHHMTVFRCQVVCAGVVLFTACAVASL